MFHSRLVRLAIVAVALVGVVSSTEAQESAKKDGPMVLGVILYPGFEPLDVFGPVEMFMNVPANLLKVVMVAEKAGPVHSTSGSSPTKFNGPAVVAEYGFEDAPHLDMLLVPGGFGTMPALGDKKLLDFLKDRSPKADYTTSVCSGSAILAKAGLLDGQKATCNKMMFDMLTANGPKVDWVPKARWVEDGKMITSSGVSAGMDMALAIVEKLWGTPMAEGIAQGTEYIWNRDSTDDPFAKE
ncbi:MAG: DJ-1/PfpI family protein [Candidatus Hydrogenedentota bacterium]